MKLSVVGICLLLLVFSNGLQAALPNPNLSRCLKDSLTRSTAPERDAARFACFSRSSNMRLSSCIREAQRMEYLLNEQEALMDCYYSNPRAWGLNNCFYVAKRLHTRTDRDSMRLDCVAQIGLPRDKNQCLKMTKSIEQSHHRVRMARACLEF